MSTINHDIAGHRFTTEVEGHTGELEYTVTGGVMSIMHTRVPPAIGGRGVAAQLMKAALQAAASNQWTVRPVCSYAVTYMKRHPDEQHHLDEMLDEALEETFPASDPPSIGHSN